MGFAGFETLRIAAFLLPCFVLTASGVTLNVKDFGAKADGRTPDRDSINRAIEAAAAGNGGTVYFPAGNYLTGSIRLRSPVGRQFKSGVVIIAPDNPATSNKQKPNPSPNFRISAIAIGATACFGAR